MCKKLFFLLFLPVFAISNAKAQACTGSGSLNITVKICAGTGSPEAAAVSVFPNPAAGSFEVKSDEPILELALIDLCGKTVWSRKGLNTNEIQVQAETFPPGMYTLRWRTDGAQGRRLLRLQH